MTPLELLQEKLDNLKRDLRKSKEQLAAGLITKDLAEIHEENITPNIQLYKDAINTLKIFGR